MSNVFLLFVFTLAAPPMKEMPFGDRTIRVDLKCERLAGDLMGPFVTTSDGSVLAVDKRRVLVSKDEGKTWADRPLFADAGKYEVRPERALLMTRDGTLILAFLNQKQMAFKWDQSQGGPQEGCRLPVYVTRSHDDGRSWDEPQRVQDGWCGAARSMIQLRSGRIVLGCQKAVTNPGQHVSLTYVSDDEGKSWKASNVIDLGEKGSTGDHGGAIEATLVQLHDGRVWMLLRTPNGYFWQASSSDDGLTWNDVRETSIQASDAPGQLRRLQSGRIVLLWNRYLDPAAKTGRREQLSMAFSDDEGRTWTQPVVLAHDPAKPGDKEGAHRLSYPYVYERVPGELWITTMQGPLRIGASEDDFLPRHMSDQTYHIHHLDSAKIEIDGRIDEADWVQADLESRFKFPWKQTVAPATEFRALCDERNLYFAFRVQDDDIVVIEKFGDELDALFEDRAEIYLSRDDRMKDYYCMEIDSRGRALDYYGSYYRKLEMGWNIKGLETKGVPTQKGYCVEGRLALENLEALGFPHLRPGVRIRGGLFRAEFSHDRSGRPVVQRESIHNRGRKIESPPPIEEWMSWIDPRTEEPDFHVPTSLGWFEVK